MHFILLFFILCVLLEKQHKYFSEYISEYMKISISYYITVSVDIKHICYASYHIRSIGLYLLLLSKNSPHFQIFRFLKYYFANNKTLDSNTLLF